MDVWREKNVHEEFFFINSHSRELSSNDNPKTFRRWHRDFFLRRVARNERGKAKYGYEGKGKIWVRGRMRFGYEGKGEIWVWERVR